MTAKDTKDKAGKATAHAVVARLRGLLVTGTNPSQVQEVIDELVAEHGEPSAADTE